MDIKEPGCIDFVVDSKALFVEERNGIGEIFANFLEIGKRKLNLIHPKIRNENPQEEIT